MKTIQANPQGGSNWSILIDGEFVENVENEGSSFDAVEDFLITKGENVDDPIYEIRKAMNEALIRCEVLHDWKEIVDAAVDALPDFFRQPLRPKTETHHAELTEDISQKDPVGRMVFGHNTDCDYYLFGCVAEASDFAAAQRDSAEAERWPMYPLFAGSPEMI